MSHHIISLLVLITCLTGAYTLRFNENGEFTVLQLTDQHYCEEHLLDVNSQNLTRYLLQTIKPDFVVFSGDAVSGYAQGSKVPGFFENCWKKFTAPVIEYGSLYAYILGNHDVDGDLNATEIAILDQTSPFSIRNSSEGIPNRTTFHVPIYASKNASQVAANMWFFDSGDTGCETVDDTWGCIGNDQLSWYDSESKKLKEEYGDNVHHVTYYHIPIPEYMTVYNTIEIYGNAGEPVSCPVVNTGFLQHIVDNGDITAMFVGHDHTNDFGGWYQGVEFIYGQKSGYGGYGTTRGGRVLTFKENYNPDGSLNITREHYVLFENGTYAYPDSYSYRQGDKQTDCVLPWAPPPVNSTTTIQI